MCWPRADRATRTLSLNSRADLPRPPDHKRRLPVGARWLPLDTVRGFSVGRRRVSLYISILKRKFLQDRPQLGNRQGFLEELSQRLPLLLSKGNHDAISTIAKTDSWCAASGIAAIQAPGHAPPWGTCEAVLSEALHLPGARGAPALSGLLRRRALIAAFNLDNDVEPVLKLRHKYADVPMSLADACLVRMAETLPDPVTLTTGSDFRIDRRHSRQVVPCVMPS